MITVKLSLGNEKQTVGRILKIDGKSFFQYSPEFLASGLNLSPFKLPLQQAVIEMPRMPFSGISGVFADSLPDGWGMLLMDRYLRQKGVNVQAISQLDRLLYIGSTAMGALSYEPDYSEQASNNELNLFELSHEASEVFHGSKKDVLPELLRAGGSPGGARPKIVVGINGESIISGEKELPPGYDAWIIKFHASKDKGDNEGLIEEAYARMLRLASINFPETQLLTVDNKHYYAVKRFDRINNERLHVHSLAGLVHANFRVPDFDYSQLLQTTNILTHNKNDMQQVYRQMIFNVLSNNQDDHTKNFSFIMDAKGEWRLSPAYDITFNQCHGGEQSMSIDGYGKNVPEHVFYNLGESCELDAQDVRQVFEETFEALSIWTTLSKELGIDSEVAKEIQGKFNDLYHCYDSMRELNGFSPS